MSNEDLSVFGQELEYENYIARSVVRQAVVYLENRLTSPLTEAECNAIAGKMSDAWTDSGPYTLDTMYQLNRLHERSVADGTGYSLSFMPNRNEFAVQTINSALHQTEVKSDNLFEAIMGTRRTLNEGE
jgi:hypothetical protein